MASSGLGHEGFFPAVHFRFELTQKGKPGILPGGDLLQLENIKGANLDAGSFGLALIQVYDRHQPAGFFFTFHFWQRVFGSSSGPRHQLPGPWREG
jgi:hypothetical protein